MNLVISLPEKLNVFLKSHNLEIDMIRTSKPFNFSMKFNIEFSHFYSTYLQITGIIQCNIKAFMGCFFYCNILLWSDTLTFNFLGG